jgi:hypothetical protein
MSIDPFIEWEANEKTYKSQECAHPCVVKDKYRRQVTGKVVWQWGQTAFLVKVVFGWREV